MLEQQKASTGHLSRRVRIVIQITEVLPLHPSAELASFDHCLAHSFVLTHYVVWSLEVVLALSGGSVRKPLPWRQPALTQHGRAVACHDGRTIAQDR